MSGASGIRSSILAGRLVPGDRLLEDALAEEFGVSRVPVREAIRRLAAEGYVTVVLSAGASVAVPSAKDAAELLQLRSALEVLAAHLRAERRGGGKLDQLAEVLQLGEAAVTAENYAVLPELWSRFHGLVIEGSGNDHLVRILADVRAKLTWIWAINIESRAATSWAAFKRIFDAVSLAEPDQAANCIASHLHLDEVVGRPGDMSTPCPWPHVDGGFHRRKASNGDECFRHSSQTTVSVPPPAGPWCSAPPLT